MLVSKPGPAGLGWRWAGCSFGPGAEPSETLGTHCCSVPAEMFTEQTGQLTNMYNVLVCVRDGGRRGEKERRV